MFGAFVTMSIILVAAFLVFLGERSIARLEKRFLAPVKGVCLGLCSKMRGCLLPVKGVCQGLCSKMRGCLRPVEGVCQGLCHKRGCLPPSVCKGSCSMNECLPPVEVICVCSKRGCLFGANRRGFGILDTKKNFQVLWENKELKRHPRNSWLIWFYANDYLIIKSLNINVVLWS